MSTQIHLTKLIAGLKVECEVLDEQPTHYETPLMDYLDHHSESAADDDDNDDDNDDDDDTDVKPDLEDLKDTSRRTSRRTRAATDLFVPDTKKGKRPKLTKQELKQKLRLEKQELRLQKQQERMEKKERAKLPENLEAQAEREKLRKKRYQEQLDLEKQKVPLQELMRSMDLMRCHVCKEEKATFPELKRHMETDHELASGYIYCCDRKHNRRTAWSHMQYHLNNEAFKCDVCGKIKTSRNELRIHMENTHPPSETLQFHCDICGKGFPRPYTLAAHRKNHVPFEERPHRCSVCPKRFTTTSNLHIHFKTQHTKEVTKFCEVCGRGFCTKNQLDIHHKTHTETKATQQCDICGKHVFGIVGHKKRVHTPVEKVNCELCGRLYLKPNQRDHMKKFHSGEKFQCHICDRVFTLQRVLQDHINTHLGVKKDCYFCPHQATASGNLVKHLNQTHPVEYAEYKAKRFSEQRIRVPK